MSNDDKPTATRFESSLAKGLMAFAEIHNRRFTPELLKIYAAALADLSLEQLDGAIALALRKLGRFPAPSDLRGFVEARTEARELFAGEEAWGLVKRIFARHWHPDLGLYGEAPALDAAAEYALQTIGGYRRFAQSEIAAENWLRKDFLEAFGRYHATSGRLAATREEARTLLAELERKRLEQTGRTEP